MIDRQLAPPGVGVVSFRAVLPGLTVIIATLIAVLPWGLPPAARFLQPMLPFTVIHYWAVRHPETMPEWLAFASGLAIDVVTNGPLGFWSLIFLVGLVTAHALEQAWSARDLAGWFLFSSTVLLMALLEWLLASAFFGTFIDWQPFIPGLALTMAGYPIVALMLRPLQRLWPRTSNGLFERGPR